MELHKASELNKLTLPEPDTDEELAILDEDISKLQKWKAHPYGLTLPNKQVLHEAGIMTIGQLANSSDDILNAIPTVGDSL